MITIRHTTLGRTSLDERSDRRKDLCAKGTSPSPDGIRTHSPSKRAAADREANGIGAGTLVFCSSSI